MKREIVFTQDAPAPIGPYSQGVKVGGTFYLSGQVALNIPGIPIGEASLQQQAEQVMKNLEAVLKAGGATFADVAKTTIFLAPGMDFDTVNKAYGKYFPSDPPARETVWVHTLPAGAKVEIGMIAVV
jgi:2-iminobutanoate/2-iminopropanoate deaminase